MGASIGKRDSLADGARLGSSFQWHDGFLVGHDGVDADHKRFFGYFSDLAREIDGPADPAALEHLFTVVLGDLGQHLMAEELFLDAIGFPETASHRTSHLMLSEQAKAAFAIGLDGEWATALRLLATSVLEHITEEDSKMRPFLAVTSAAE